MIPNPNQGNMYKYFVLLVLLAASVHSDNTQHSRCPKSSNDTINLIADKKICNIYHECFCHQQDNYACSFVRTHVCPMETVYVPAHRRCEPIEKLGCNTSYLHWISPSFKPDNIRLKQIPAEPLNITGISTFTCPSYATNDRFPDPNICNLFHVCVKRDNVTYDQPFLCPFSSIFRVNDSNTMYCDTQSLQHDCHNKAFYRSIDTENLSEFIKLNSLIIETQNANGTCDSEPKEDPTYCNTFHACTNGKDEHFMCEYDLLFNPISGICDYPINVPCKKKIFQKSELLSTDTDDEKVLKSKMQSLILYPSDSFENAEELDIYGVKIGLKCPIGAKNYIYPDREYCNVFHHCHGFSGKVSICEKGQAFDPTANGVDQSGVCNFENLVDCTGKFILTETGKRAGKSVKNPEANIYRVFKDKYDIKVGEPHRGEEELIEGILFDCMGKPNGHYRDYIYCDVFHACISNERKKTYSCAHMGERTYFDDTTKRCEFLKSNPSVCMHNMFYKSIVQPLGDVNKVEAPVDEYNEKWKVYIRSREPFSCIGKMDGFYASRWCNVFYRCFLGIRTEFLCPKMLNENRLWWVQHDSSQELAQTSAACVWPCETNGKCMSPGGIIVEKPDGDYIESITESDRVWEASECQAKSDSPSLNKYDISAEDFNCYGKQEGNFYASKYCNVFHRCSNGKRADFKCPRATNTPYDLWWNSELDICDWPCKINCTSEVYGTSKKSSDIQAEDLYYNEQECTAHIQKTTTPQPQATPITTKLIKKPFPDDGFVCMVSGLVPSPVYCNVYYSCKSYGQPPQFAFYCEDGHFDPNTNKCKTKQDYPCGYSPQLSYPLIAIGDVTTPEEATCAARVSYVKSSQRYGNLFYKCDGYSSVPKAFRCFDREKMEDAFYSKEFNMCIRKKNTKFGSHTPMQVLHVKTRYQSSPVDHTRFVDLQPLSCRVDQQYLAEHDKYCNLYHSCILGKYQMYACQSIGEFDKSSYFYYTNGNCGAPTANKCSFGKTLYDYTKLFPNTKLSKQNLSIKTSERFISKVASSISTVSLHETYGPIIKVKNQETAPTCSIDKEFVQGDPNFCNLFYNCQKGQLSSYICIDNTSGQLNGIFDTNLKTCVAFNISLCLSNALYNPKQTDITSTKPDQEIKVAIEPTVTMKQEKFTTNSNFSCHGRKNGYYESEWCNVFFQCVSGKRIDSRCSSSLSNVPDYDLWWLHQNVTFEPESPFRMQGDDVEARCEYPCKIKCEKKIWTMDPAAEVSTYEKVLEIENELRPKCQAIETTSKEYEISKLSSPDPSGFMCDGRKGTFRDPLFCNIFHECMGGEKKTSFMCKSSLFDVNSDRCVSMNEGFSKCTGLIYEADFMYVPALKDLPAVDGACSKNGVFKAVGEDKKSYCDLFYWCSGVDESPIYFHCDVDYLTKEAALFNIETKRCELKPVTSCKSSGKVYSKALKLKTSFLEGKVEEKDAELANSLFNYQMNLNKISDYVSENKLPYFEGQNNTSV